MDTAASKSAWAALASQAMKDEESVRARHAVCEALGQAFRSTGHLLWHGGYVVGGDRVAGKSPFQFGSDAAVGLGIVCQISGELLAGIRLLLAEGNQYGAWALVRQFVECEYLAWAFAEDQEEAASWMRSTKDQRLKMWQPRHIRDRAAGRFRGADYAHHCELGGHPTPESRVLLPCHQHQTPTELAWWEIATHGTSAWSYVQSAGEALGYGDWVRDAATKAGLSDAVLRWREQDRFRRVGEPPVPE